MEARTDNANTDPQAAHNMYPQSVAQSTTTGLDSQSETLSEKHVGIAPTDQSQSEADLTEQPRSGMDRDWTPEEEKRLVRRIDFALLPILILGFFMLQLDRSNIGNAVTDNFMAEVGITQYQFNSGTQLMFAGIVIFEIPSNLILYRVGPAVWIGFQMFAWGLIATFQAFIRGQGYGAYMTTRFLLGVFECGYIPAGLYTITRFYTTRETSKRFAFFFMGNLIANGSSGLMAYGILPMRGINGLSGWQWLFIIEGSMTLFIALLFVIILPRGPENPVSLVGIRYFNERETSIIVERVLQDDPTKVHPRPHVSPREIWDACTNWRLIGHILTIMAALAASAALFPFAPQIAASYGYSRLQANAMASIGFWVLIITTFAWGWAADRLGRRGPIVLAGVFISWVMILANRLTSDSTNFDARFALLVLMISFSFNWQPLQGAWMSVNCKSAGERSVTMAIFVMATNCAGVIAGQIFQQRDYPEYRRAWTITLSLSSVGLAAAIFTCLQYWVLNLRNARNGGYGWVYKS
ncbi:hypothetical protein S7711_01833 [Stachybotrys chartarum IBT 7711]|uniref:Major facilitator superfamily (MFS) profile domain-containing protein n=1 Tax=Stachybotrys chartarum (strain CBS 109288 / IBT 7711) TaxID=1280523 RepID=A0A084AJ40_STACB|nr:hypothetical protein S7711_01833 [Stachybotrys chartarum IBT 7711]KFA73881.1 hypothetical protein S40288_00928 [Stachybotrys chartarum IBT 40288]